MNASDYNRKLTKGRMEKRRTRQGVTELRRSRGQQGNFLDLANRLTSSFLLIALSLFFLSYLFIHCPFEMGSHPGCPWTCYVAVLWTTVPASTSQELRLQICTIWIHFPDCVTSLMTVCTCQKVLSCSLCSLFCINKSPQFKNMCPPFYG